MKRTTVILLAVMMAIVAHAKTLIVYYSYTNHVQEIVTELCRQIEADVLRIEPAEKGLDYAANNYALGSALISAIRSNPDDASSYPAIDPVNIDLGKYDCIIIGAPLWWGNMAAPLQSYLFQNGEEMAGKKIGLIVSSSSTGISGVESDARRLIPEGDFLTPSLWIRSSQLSTSPSLISEWLKATGYDLPTGIENEIFNNSPGNYSIFTVDGRLVGENILSLQNLERGLYIIKGRKTYLSY